MDMEVSYHAVERLYADKAKWEQVKKSHSEERKIYQGMISELKSFTGKVRLLRRQIDIMTEQYFEPLKQKKISVNERNAAVAEAMKILEMSERGELTDDEMKARFETF